jgi:hypothetical protein
MLGGTMNKLFERIKDIYLSPATFWDETKSEQKSETDLIKSFFIYIAAVPMVAGFLGMLFMGENLFRALVWAVLFLGCALAGVFLFSKVVLFLGRSFGAGNKNLDFVTLAVYSFTPILLAGVFFIIPPIYWLTIVGLYGVYFFWVGFQKIVVCNKEEKFNFSFISLIVFIILTMLIYLLPALFSGAAVYYYII